MTKLSMTKKNSVESCIKKLEELGQHDTYFGKRNQSADIENKISELEEALQRLEKDIQSRLLRIMEETRADFAKQIELINETKVTLDEIFATVDSPPNKAINFKRASHSLHQNVNWLSRKLRPRLLRALERLSPKYKILEKPLQDLNNFRLHIIKPLEEFLYLLQFRKQRQEIVGSESIFELDIAPKLEQLCANSLFRYIRIRWFLYQCRRRYTFFQLPFKPIIVECLINGSEIDPQRLVQRHNATHTELNNHLADAWRSIHYNLETAATEFEDISDNLRNDRPDAIAERPAELHELVDEALGKCLNTIDDVTVTYASFLEAIAAEISEDHNNAINAIRKGIRDSRQFKTRMRWKFRLIRRYWYRRIDSGVGYLAQKFGKFLRYSQKLFFASSWWDSLLQRFKAKEPVVENLLRLTDLPTEEELLETCKNLPPIYRRLYKNEPLTNREFLVGMEEELELIKDSLQRWQSDRASSVAVVGPEGSGKTSLFNCFENDLAEDIQVVRSELQHRLVTSSDVIALLDGIIQSEEPSSSLGELISKILHQGRQIIMLENCHQLFLRVVGGREALDAFFYVLMNTRAQVFWLLSFRYLPWTRLGYLNNIERFFTHVIKSEFHSVQEMISALLIRQRATGQEVVFSELGVSSHKLKKLMTKYKVNDAPVQSLLAEIYFDNLYAISGGNMESALYYWLQSLELDEQSRIIVKPCVKVDSGFIKRLDTTSLLSLTEVLAHGSLSPKEHSQIFNLEEFRSRVVLDSLRQIRLLQGISHDKHGQPQYYCANALFYTQLRSVLSDLHMIY